MNTNGSFASTSLGGDAADSRAVAAGDLNGDAFVDLVFANAGSSSVLINTGAGAFTPGAGEFGQPDSTPPVLQLRGQPTVSVIIDSTYTDAGATATDAEDGDITSRIVVTNSVNTTVLGSYTVTYAVSDLSGNPAVPITRTVTVQPQPAAEGGGGGAFGFGALAALLLAAMFRARRKRLVR